MTKVLNAIWILFLAVTLGSLANTTQTASKEFSEDIVLDTSYSSVVDNSQKTLCKDAELGGVILHHNIIFSRTSQASGNVNIQLLKIERHHVCYGNTLIRHLLKQALLFNSIPLSKILSCEYYVFALRQLLI